MTPKLEPFAKFEVELGAPIEMGPGRAGKRRIIPIVGGKVTGRVTGEVLNLGADWQTVLADGTAAIDTRYAMRTHAGAVIEIINQGFRHGPPEVLAALARGEAVARGSYYFRTVARLETGDRALEWVNRMIFIGTGERLANAVRMSLFEVR